MRVNKVLSLEIGDIISHPVFRDMLIKSITVKDEGYSVEVLLLDFNDTIRHFDAIELSRIKFKRKTMLKVLK